MPAVTADTLTLPRLPELPHEVTGWRPVLKTVTATHSVEGEGFAVRRPFPTVDLSMADPFLMLDHLGAVEYAPGEAKGAPWHPHRGFETVTYVIDGAWQHADSTGGGGVIADGQTQWMTAGSVIPPTAPAVAGSAADREHANGPASRAGDGAVGHELSSAASTARARPGGTALPICW